MKFTVNLNQFREAFGVAAAATPSRTPKEILKNVRCTASSGKLQLIGASGEMSIQRDIPADIRQSGECLFPVDTTKAWLSRVNAEVLYVEVVSDKVSLSAGRAKATVPTENPADFPPVDLFSPACTIQVNAHALAAALRRVVFACDAVSLRYALGGVLFEPTKSGLSLAATDSRRMSLCSVDVTVHGSADKAVVPQAAIKAVLSPLSDMGVEDTIEVHLSPNRARFECGDTIVTSHLVEGRFPRYQDVIPKCQHAVTFSPEKLLEAVRQVESFTSIETNAVDFTFDRDLVSLHAESAARGMADTSAELQYSGEPITLTLDPRFIAEPLRLMGDAKSATWGLIDADSACMITLDGWRYVVMPLSRDRQ